MSGRTQKLVGIPGILAICSSLSSCIPFAAGLHTGAPGLVLAYMIAGTLPPEVRRQIGELEKPLPDFSINGSPPLPYPSTPPAGPPGPQLQAVASAIPASGQTSGHFVLADFNGDGVADTATLVSSSIRVNLYNADGSTLSTQEYAISNLGSSIVTADFSGDGVLDLALVQNQGSGPASILILLGNGDGTFAAPQPVATFSATQFPFYLVVADLNGDGIADLAVTMIAGSGAGSVGVLLGKGNGTFAPVVTYQVGLAPATIVADDFNGDGKTDLVVLDAQIGIVNKAWTLLGRGDGTFLPAVSTITPTVAGYVSYVDLNHDGNLDLVIADQLASAMAIMFGNGDGTFQAAKEYLATSQVVSILPLPVQDGTTMLLMIDNVAPEIITFFATSDGTVKSPLLQTLGQQPAAIATADLNGDSQPDLVITDSAASDLIVKLGSGGGVFAGTATYPLGSQPGPLALADVNRDGRVDALVADSNGIEVLLGNGDGTFAPTKTVPASATLSSLVVADFNGDGKPDIGATDNSSGGAFVFLGNGDGTFQASSLVSLGPSLTALTAATADVNGDGKADLVVAFSPIDPTQPGGLAVLLGNANGTFQTSGNIILPGPMIQQPIGAAATAALVIGDLNKDGKPDIATAVSTGGGNQIVVLLGNGDGSFRSPALQATHTSPPMIAIADIFGNGNPDLLLTDCCGLSEGSFLAGNGDGTFQSEVSVPSGPNPRWVAIADFNHDGKPDAAIVGQIQQNNQGTLAVVINAFTTSPTSAAVISSANANATAIAPGSLASIYGNHLATSSAGVTTLPLPVTEAGTSVSLIDSSGTTVAAPLLYVSPEQVNFYVPTGMAAGLASVTVTSGDGIESATAVDIAPVAPGLFELNSSALAAAEVLLVSGSSQTYEQVYTVNSTGAIVAAPVNISSAGAAYLLLYGTGLQAAGTSGVSVTLNGAPATVIYAGPQGSFVGLDQVNVLLPTSLAGQGNVTVQLTADGIAANAVSITIQ